MGDSRIAIKQEYTPKIKITFAKVKYNVKILNIFYNLNYRRQCFAVKKLISSVECGIILSKQQKKERRLLSLASSSNAN